MQVIKPVLRHRVLRHVVLDINRGLAWRVHPALLRSRYRSHAGIGGTLTAVPAYDLTIPLAARSGIAPTG
jgi:hypothetical protein